MIGSFRVTLNASTFKGKKTDVENGMKLTFHILSLGYFFDIIILFLIAESTEVPDML